MDKAISRRNFIRGGVSGLGAVAAMAALGGTAVASTDARGKAPEPAQGKTDPRNGVFGELLSPITVGTELGSTRVVAMKVDWRGLGVVTLEDESGRKWDAEICRRASTDESLKPVAVSQHYSLFLRNSGNGSAPTDESVGRAVLALAECVKRNEGEAAGLALSSRTEVWASEGYSPSTVEG